MQRIDCFALGLDARRTASTSAHPNFRVFSYYEALRPIATKRVRSPDWF